MNLYVFPLTQPNSTRIFTKQSQHTGGQTWAGLVDKTTRIFIAKSTLFGGDKTHGYKKTFRRKKAILVKWFIYVVIKFSNRAETIKLCVKGLLRNKKLSVKGLLRNKFARQI